MALSISVAVVAVDVHPERGDGVQVLAPAGVEEPAAVGVIDDHRLVAGQGLEPGLHLREGMPDVGAVQRGQALRGGPRPLRERWGCRSWARF